MLKAKKDSRRVRARGQLMVLVTPKWRPRGCLDKLPLSHSLCLLTPALCIEVALVINLAQVAGVPWKFVYD